MQSTAKKFSRYLPLLVLTLYLFVGLRVYRDYGASADEHIQIEGGHVMWDYINGKLFGKDPVFPELPPLSNFQNRYYGQAATFPTVLIEALKGFQLDSSSILRIRHLWNFFTWWAAIGCLGFLFYRRSQNGSLAALGMCMMILLPKLFGDAFYNDRDILLLAWMIFTAAAFEVFRSRPGWVRALLFALVLALAVNTRIFALMFLALPGFYFLRAEKSNKKYAIGIFAAAAFFWLLFYPMAWENPLKTLPDAFYHFRTQQRSLDTDDAGKLLFMGKTWFENDLPWYYLPVWIVISTPLAVLLFSAVGFSSRIKRIFRKEFGEPSILDDTLTLVFFVSLAAVIGLKLTLYTGWRHFYFLYFPIVWFAFLGLQRLWENPKRLVPLGTLILLLISFGEICLWMKGAHPYEYVYFNPLFRKTAPGRFDRDYWVLSTTEMMNHLAETSPSESLTVVDHFSFPEYTIIGLPPQIRERFHVMGYSVQRSPYEYFFYNYANAVGNEKKFPYYAPIYAVERDGVKLAEISQRTHTDEITGAEAIRRVKTSTPDGTERLRDGDFGTFWQGKPAHTEDEWIELELNQPYLLNSMELFPGEYAVNFEYTEISLSSDGITWEKVKLDPKGSNGFSFEETSVSAIRIENKTNFDYPWGFREIYLYGKPLGNLDVNKTNEL